MQRHEKCAIMILSEQCNFPNLWWTPNIPRTSLVIIHASKKASRSTKKQINKKIDTYENCNSKKPFKKLTWPPTEWVGLSWIKIQAHRAPGWLSQLTVGFQLRSGSHNSQSWDRAPRQKQKQKMEYNRHKMEYNSVIKNELDLYGMGM